jgi:hypothetical protein
MSPKRTLLLISILTASIAIHFWSTEPDPGQANAAALLDDAPLVAFDRATINVVEADAGENEILTVQVVISRAPEQEEEVQVKVLGANGSAIAGVDFEALSVNLTFPAGSTEPQSFDVVIFGNNVDQPDRAFVVFLTNPVNAAVGIPSAVTITILDDDPPAPAARAKNFLPVIRGFVAGPTRTP